MNVPEAAQQYSSTQNDGVCFSSGLMGVAFGAGVIHAYLTADRKPPVVVAGISVGALSAAAFQRCYQELDQAKLDYAKATDPSKKEKLRKRIEAARWEWFRQYLSFLIDRPFDILWNAVPDVSDFIAELPPVKDPALPDGKERRIWEQRDCDARRALFIIVKLGRWLARLPISVGFLSMLIIDYIRFKEGYPKGAYPWIKTRVTLGMGFCIFVFRLAWHVARHPQWFPEHEFKIVHRRTADTRSFLFRPLLGWVVWLTAVVYCIATVGPWMPSLFRVLSDVGQHMPIAVLLRFLGMEELASSFPKNLHPDVLLSDVARFLSSLHIPVRSFSFTIPGNERIYQFISGGLFLGPVLFIAIRGTMQWAFDHLRGLLWRIGVIFGVVELALMGWKIMATSIRSARRGLGRIFTKIGTWLASFRLIAFVARILASQYRGLQERRSTTRDESSREYRIIPPTSIRYFLSAVRGLRHFATDTIVGFLRTIGDLLQYGLLFTLGKKLLVDLGVQKALLKDFHLHIRLLRLFQRGDTGDPILTKDPMPALLVAAPLQKLPSNKLRANYPAQLSASIRGSVGVVQALRACLALPGVFAPVTLEKPRDKSTPDPRKDWLPRGQDQFERIDLVNGTVVRHNPLPALFRFLDENKQFAQPLIRDPESQDQPAQPCVHLVYDVPIRPDPKPSADLDDPKTPEPPLPNIIECAFKGAALSRRRDSRAEVLRTNFLAEAELELERLDPKAKTRREALPITIDEIAPDFELRFKRGLSPSETEILSHAAEGCRLTLSRVYADELKSRPWEKVHWCPSIIPSIATTRNWANSPVAPSERLPGLTEICRHCTKNLEVPKTLSGTLPATFAEQKLSTTFPSLIGITGVSSPVKGHSRLVFVASGGVFRGSFHIGMLAALTAINLQPDLIVGASVGTLMGAALGAMLRNPGEASRVLAHLTWLFTNVDEQVALTKVLKSASKDLGMRARKVNLSPNELRKAVKKGAKADAGLAITGAPPALIDALANLFIIPYSDTRDIAAHFVGGEVARAAEEFWTKIESYTIDRLGIRDSVIGTSLLETEFRKLLGEVGKQGAQPFLEYTGTGFFGTAVNLVTRQLEVMGADIPVQDVCYDFVKAALASSAFPAAFAPVRQSEIYPSHGRRDLFFGDGGMFDNLPFLTTIEILRDVQRDYIQSRMSQSPDYWIEALKGRAERPDLFLVGALNANAPDAPEATYDTVKDITARAQALSQNEKIIGFQKSSLKIDRLVKRLAAKAKPGAAVNREFLNGIVNAAVLPVYPVDQDHLNGTFQFCSAVGLRRNKVSTSIADGCFQTLYAFSKAQRGPLQDPANRSVRNMQADGRMPRIVLKRDAKTDGGECPFFMTNAGSSSPQPKRFICPFQQAAASNPKAQAAAVAVHDACRSDSVHWLTTESAVGLP